MVVRIYNDLKSSYLHANLIDHKIHILSLTAVVSFHLVFTNNTVDSYSRYTNTKSKPIANML